MSTVSSDSAVRRMSTCSSLRQRARESGTSPADRQRSSSTRQAAAEKKVSWIRSFPLWEPAGRAKAGPGSETEEKVSHFFLLLRA